MLGTLSAKPVVPQPSVASSSAPGSAASSSGGSLAAAGRHPKRTVSELKAIHDQLYEKDALNRGNTSASLAERSESWVKQHCGRLRSRSRALCDSWRFCVLTTVLTIYALFGDDFRLAVTHQAMDNLFNVITMLCIIVFTVEIVAASLGKEEYFLGFFFLLDFGATVTLLFDLTWIWNEFTCSTADGGSGALKTSRAGRAGARAARTVRIFRLIRLVKLYKTYQNAFEQKDGSARRRVSANSDSAGPGLEGDFDDDVLSDEDEENMVLVADSQCSDSATDSMNKSEADRKNGQLMSETRVGKKLSDMTTRRVIVLVLVMLFVMPLFQTTAYGFNEFRTSGDMGAELVYDRFRAWCLDGNTSQPGELPWCLQALQTPADARAEDLYAERAWFEEYLLSYIYAHHVGDFAWKLYWIGFQSTALAELPEVNEAEYLSELARLNQERFLGPYVLPRDRLSEWDRRFSDSGWQASVAPLPESVRWRLADPWIERCSNYYGVAVSLTGDDPSTDCSFDEDLRCSEQEMYVPLTNSQEESRKATMMFLFDIRSTSQLGAGLSILQTIFICFAVGIGAMSFSHDVNTLLLNPIERMISKMEAIKDNPLYAMKLGDIEYRREEIEHERMKEELARMSRCWQLLYMGYNMKKVKEPMETAILEKTIIKLGGLLALGFGEAGAEIIGHNMRGGTSTVDAMVPGQKVDAIIGFCNIRDFGDATEVLKENVMMFVNQIGEIVHGCVDDYHGAPNKNIGDCFLLVWRLSGASEEKQQKLADMAIMSFVRILAEINKSRVLAVYRDHPGLLQRLPKYRVEMGFGLHCGWAIEGAIGSEFKIDASYLSPNVNVSSRLQAATEQYGVWLLISHFMVLLCSPDLAAYCRLIDHITVKGSKQPIRLYTIDLDYLQLQVKKKTAVAMTKNRFKLRQLREVRKSEKWAEDYCVSEAFTSDEDLIAMRATYDPEFFMRFAMAFRNYEAGEWLVARDMFFTCHYAPDDSTMDFPSRVSDGDWPVDGPTCTLLRFMRQTYFHPPSDWTGHRELTEK